MVPRPLRHCGLLALTALGLGTGLQAQEGGLTATFDISESLRVDDNREFREDSAGTSTVARTDLTFGLTSETRSQSLDFALGATLDAGYFAREDAVEAELERYFASLGYSRESRDALIGFTASYTVSDVTRTDDGSDLDIQDSITAEGERELTALAVTLETGRTAGIGSRITADVRTRRFSDIDDPDLFDTDEFGISGALIFRPSRTLGVRLTGAARRYEAENTEETRRTSYDLGFGLDYQATPRLAVSADAGFTRIETTETLGGIAVDETEEGPFASLGLTLAHPDGSSGLALATRTESTGNRVEARATRDFVLRTGTLDLMLGVSASEETDARLFGGLGYTQDFRSGAFRFDVTQRVFSTAEEDEILETRAGLAFSRDLTPVSEIDLSAGFTDINVLAGTDTEDRRNFDLGLTYRHDLTRDWAGFVGYEYRRITRDTAADRQSNAVFLGIERSFSFRP